jgi:DNA repair exonuclease SbcCD ATPase subunit
MKIIQLQAENFKRLKAIDISPEGNCVIISGMNGNGKTSVLDAIWMALQYRAAIKGNPNPLRAGAHKGTVTIDLGDYIITRRFTENDSILEIKTPDGSKIPSPQKLLDGFIGELSFDPWDFLRKSEKDQRNLLGDILFKLTDGKLDLAEFDKKKEEDYNARTTLNREKSRINALLTNIAPPSDKDPVNEKSVVALTSSIQDAIEHNNQLKNIFDVTTSKQNDIARWISEINVLQDKINQAKEDIAKDTDRMAGLSPRDVFALQEELKNIEDTNKRAREVIEYNKLRNELVDIEKSVERLNDSIELIEIQKAEALEATSLPIQNLVINADGLRYLTDEKKEIPFCQASSAQQLRIALAIAMAANPTLRIIRIADGSLLDDNSMKIIKEMATDQDFQIWVEYASRNENDKIGIYIEDGTIVS